MTGALFRDRRDAAEQLVRRLDHLRGEQPIVLGLPRGGVPIAALVADRLGAPLDILVVRKVGLPYHRELAMGAVGEGGVSVADEGVITTARVAPDDVARVLAEERAEVERRGQRYRDGRAPIPITDRTVVIVDDGIATGSTARAAVQIARARGARRVVLAAPVAAARTVHELSAEVDEVVVVAAPDDFMAVGQFYRDFSPTSDAEVASLLAAAASPVHPVSDGIEEDVAIPVIDDVVLHGRLTVPCGARGTVLFAHGSGSSARSPRNQYVAERLNQAGIGTLLFDLLTATEERDRSNVFDVELLSERLRVATRWLTEVHPDLSRALGYFGASTGAAAALRAAAHPAVPVDAVVSRGGRPDLAGDALEAVDAPTLLIVGGNDDVVLQLNDAAAARLRCERRIAVVPGATHLFEEPGALDAVARLAIDWFSEHLGGGVPRGRS
jgi:putative phosphoribosyl transferase